MAGIEPACSAFFRLMYSSFASLTAEQQRNPLVPVGYSGPITDRPLEGRTDRGWSYQPGFDNEIETYGRQSVSRPILFTG